MYNYFFFSALCDSFAPRTVRQLDAVSLGLEPCAQTIAFGRPMQLSDKTLTICRLMLGYSLLLLLWP